MSTRLAQAIKFRSIVSKLNNNELQQLVNDVIKNCAIKTFAEQVLFAYFTSEPKTKHYKNVLINNLLFACDCASEIMQERKHATHETKHTLTMQPEDIIGNVASFCHVRDYVSLSLSCRDLFWITQTPNQQRFMVIKLPLCYGQLQCDTWTLLPPKKNGTAPKYPFPNITTVVVHGNEQRRCDEETEREFCQQNLFDWNQITTLVLHGFGKPRLHT